MIDIDDFLSLNSVNSLKIQIGKTQLWFFSTRVTKAAFTLNEIESDVVTNATNMVSFIAWVREKHIRLKIYADLTLPRKSHPNTSRCMDNEFGRIKNALGKCIKTPQYRCE